MKPFIIKGVYKIPSIGVVLEVQLNDEGGILKRGMKFHLKNKNIYFAVKDIERDNFDLLSSEYVYKKYSKNVYPILVSNFENGSYKDLEVDDELDHV